MKQTVPGSHLCQHVTQVSTNKFISLSNCNEVGLRAVEQISFWTLCTCSHALAERASLHPQRGSPGQLYIYTWSYLFMKSKWSKNALKGEISDRLASPASRPVGHVWLLSSAESRSCRLGWWSLKAHLLRQRCYLVSIFSLVKQTVIYAAVC